MEQTEIITFIVIANILLLIFIVGIVLFIIQYRKRKIEYTNETMIMKTKHNQEILSTRLEIQTQTMQHIGREIHDNVGQKLTLASLYTQQLSFENKAPQINDKIENISSIINESLQELRRLSKSLTDDDIAEKDFIFLLKEECKKVNDLNKCLVLLDTNTSLLTLSYQTKGILLRIVQEFFQNSIKHSECKNIHVSLEKESDDLLLNLKDDGIGFNVKSISNSGIGIKNMRKRIELLGGSIEINSIVKQGTSINIKIPLDNEA